jgi:hypothetical protein
MSFTQASPLTERPRDLLNKKTGVRRFGTPVSLTISSFSSEPFVIILLFAFHLAVCLNNQMVSRKVPR